MPAVQEPPDARARLLDAAFESLEAEGVDALTTRALTAKVGLSTMAVYTHFGGMPGLMEALVREGFRRFAARVRARPVIEEPMADLMSGGLAYGSFAVEHPQLYQLIFGLTGDGRVPSAPALSAPWRTPEGEDALSVLLESVERVLDAGLLPPQDARVAAAQILSATHGFILLMMGGFLDDEESGAMMGPLAVNLMVGLGAERAVAEQALVTAAAAAAGR